MLSLHVFILLVLIIISFFAFRRDNNQYDQFQLLNNTEDRQRFFKKWTIEPFILYGLSSVLILFFLGELSALNRMPLFLNEFTDLLGFNSTIAESDIISGFIKGIKISLIPALVFGSIIATYIREKSMDNSHLYTSNNQSADGDFRNLDALIPRNLKERFWCALLSLNAGFSEELFFRILAPILIYNVSGSALVAILASTIWFGLAHYYQGLSGILVTFLVGLLLFAVYLISKNIWITMMVHAIFDLNGLVLGPWLKEKFARDNNSSTPN